MNYYEEEENYMADLDAAEQERQKIVKENDDNGKLELQIKNLSDELETGE